MTALAPGEPARMFPPLAPGLAGVWIGGGARVDGRAIRDCLLRAAVARGARRLPGTATLARAAGQATGVTVGADRIGADTVVVAAGAWTAGICAQLGIRLPVGPQRGQIVHARLPRTDTAGWPVVLSGQDPYLVAFPAGRIVLGATREQAGFAYHTTVGGVGALLAGAAGLAPGLREAELLETRIGFRPVTSDGRPLLGPLANGLIVATGHGAEGLTAGPWSGLAIALLALGQPPATDLTPFAPNPIPRLTQPLHTSAAGHRHNGPYQRQMRTGSPGRVAGICQTSGVYEGAVPVLGQCLDPARQEMGLEQLRLARGAAWDWSASTPGSAGGRSAAGPKPCGWRQTTTATRYSCSSHRSYPPEPRYSRQKRASRRAPSEDYNPP